MYSVWLGAARISLKILMDDVDYLEVADFMVTK